MSDTATTAESAPPAQYETPTEELRQVRHECWETVRTDPMTGAVWKRPLPVYYTVQRKWLVQDGPRYYSRPPMHRNDWMDMPILSGWGWCFKREEWRDLPSVTVSE